MGKISKKSASRRAKKMMKEAGIVMPVKKATGGLSYSSKGKKANPHTNSTIGKKKIK